MFRIPNILIIGSTGRNTGKTEFACELIRKYRDQGTVIGVKITAIDEEGSACPRGGDGCGVCSSFTGKYSVTEERGGPAGKDTVRMLEAGAHKVYWLRVKKRHLQEGVSALTQLFAESDCVICESNSSRQVLEPGFFMVMREEGSRVIKKTCRDVIKYADKVVTFHGFGWDISPGDVNFIEGKWSYQESATAVVLAGGDSRRMGKDKSLLSIAGKPMIEHIIDQLRHNFKHLYISAADAAKYGFLNVPVISDQKKGVGPLMGILSSLEKSSTDLIFVTACDAPNINLPIVRKMLLSAENYDAVIPLSGNGLYEPLFAVYRKSVVDHCHELIKAGEKRVSKLCDRIRVNYLHLESPDWYVNINTPEEYNQYTRPYKPEHS
ncbi:MAG: molybdenum cofactor guanylyltransferase [SAR324 cluster bacterium]|nr:molybdenum cofactor guanylyltransferase [SAR324 cluster bacterium]